MRILIVDDDKIITYALKTIIESEEDMSVVAVGFSCDEAIQLYRESQPDIALLDIRMGERTGLDALDEILAIDPQAKVIFLTTFLDDEYIIKAISKGSKGYLLKSEFENIIPALRAVGAGQIVYEAKVVEKIPSLLQSGVISGVSADLTEKEIEIMAKVADGFNNREIATLLYLSEGTIRNYISSILDKLELRDRTQLAIYYLKNK
ncbi:MAG: response regulator transcription factor [Tissierellia bacterium]|nr:response regulator transcription factor [Tissierellia bacterium]